MSQRRLPIPAPAVKRLCFIVLSLLALASPAMGSMNPISGTPPVFTVCGATGASVQQIAAANASGVVCTGTNDQAAINNWVVGLTNGGAVTGLNGATVKFVGNFNFTDTAYWLLGNSTLDWTGASFNIPSTFSAGGAVGWSLGTPYFVPIGSTTWSTGLAPTFVSTSGGFPTANGTPYALQCSGAAPGGYTASNIYWVCGYVSNGNQSFSFQLANSYANAMANPPVPLVATSAGTAVGLSPRIAVVTTANILTDQGTNYPTMANGTAIIFNEHTVPTGTGSTTMYTRIPYYVRQNTAGTYKLYSDPALQNHLTFSTSGSTQYTYETATTGIRTIDGTINVAYGATAYYAVRENIGNIGTVIRGLTVQATGAPYTSFGVDGVFLNGNYSHLEDSTIIGMANGVDVEGSLGDQVVGNTFIDSTGYGAFIPGNTSTPIFGGIKVLRNSFLNGASSGVYIGGGSGFVCIGNNNGAGGSVPQIVNGGTANGGTYLTVGPNTYNLVGSETNISDSGSSTTTAIGGND
jgi:hypothetical protein